MEIILTIIKNNKDEKYLNQDHYPEVDWPIFFPDTVGSCKEPAIGNLSIEMI